MELTLTCFPSYSHDYDFSFANTEFDISEYQNKFAARRDENSLFLRRTDLSGMKKTNTKSYKTEVETDSNSLANNINELKASLKSQDSDQIVKMKTVFLDQKENLAPVLASDDELIELIINSINSCEDLTLEASLALIEFVMSIIPNSSKKVSSKIIVEIGIKLYIIIQNCLDKMNGDSDEDDSLSNDLAMLPYILNLIQTFTEYSIYSRFAMISFGILDSTMSIALKNVDDDLTNLCLKTIQSILTNKRPKQNINNLSSSSFSSLPSFEHGMKSKKVHSTRSIPSLLTMSQIVLDSSNDSNQESEFQIDISNVESIIDPLFKLLRIKLEKESNIPSISIIINIFVELTNILPILIKKLYNNELYDLALESLLVPELTKDSIKLISNLPASSILSYVQHVIDKGLFEKLMQLIQDEEYTSDVFKTISNFIECAPQFVLPQMNTELINLSVEIASQSPFKIKTEIAYFLSDLIFFMSDSDVVNFLVKEEIIEMISEMLNSGIENLTIKCIGAFQKLFDLAVQLNSGKLNCTILLKLFESCDVAQKLDEIIQQIDQKNTILISCASCLYYNIQGATE